jgi:hypothetical protein
VHAGLQHLAHGDGHLVKTPVVKVETASAAEPTGR